MLDIGKNIKKARQKRGLSQEELAHDVGITKSTISKYELGHREPSFEQLKKIAKVLDVTVGYLQGYESFDAKLVMDALKSNDYRTLEKLLCMPENSMIPIPPEEESEIRKQVAQERQDSIRYINRLRLNIEIFYTPYGKFTEQDYDSLRNLIELFSKLSSSGQEKAVSYIKDLARITEYQREQHPAPKQSSPTSQESTDTTTPPDGSEGPQEDE